MEEFMLSVHIAQQHERKASGKLEQDAVYIVFNILLINFAMIRTTSVHQVCQVSNHRNPISGSAFRMAENMGHPLDLLTRFCKEAVT
jgi:hypothetical protein